MKLSEFDYLLPPELIAQSPAPERDGSRMMVLNRGRQSVEHRRFSALAEEIGPGDVLVVNDSKVIPARLTGVKDTGGTVEILLLTRHNGTNPRREVWDVLLKPAKRLRAGTRLAFGNDGEAVVAERLSEKAWRLAFATRDPFDAFLDACGSAPLPPYIKRQGMDAIRGEDIHRYQTVYARVPGSVAAPTAGFHFSPAVFQSLEKRGAAVAHVTLHVGFGTFSPITAENIADHRMEEESFEIGPDAARRINDARRVIAVGTTATRVIESASDDGGTVHPTCGRTGLFISPGYRFKRIDALLTNFHLPKSSLYVLACAFGGRPLIEQAYAAAIAERYRFYSYGDCMLIL